MSQWWANPNASLFPGDRIAVQIGDRLIHHRITEIRRDSGQYTPPPPRTRWQRITRTLTPPRWRQPLPQGTRGLDTVQISSVPIDGSAPDDPGHPPGRAVPAPNPNQ